MLNDTGEAEGKRHCPPFNPLLGFLIIPAIIVYFKSLEAASALREWMVDALRSVWERVSRIATSRIPAKSQTANAPGFASSTDGGRRNQDDAEQQEGTSLDTISGPGATAPVHNEQAQPVPPTDLVDTGIRNAGKATGLGTPADVERDGAVGSLLLGLQNGEGPPADDPLTGKAAEGNISVADAPAMPPGGGPSTQSGSGGGQGPNGEHRTVSVDDGAHSSPGLPSRSADATDAGKELAGANSSADANATPPSERASHQALDVVHGDHLPTPAAQHSPGAPAEPADTPGSSGGIVVAASPAGSRDGTPSLDDPARPSDGSGVDVAASTAKELESPSASHQPGAESGGMNCKLHVSLPIRIIDILIYL